MDLSLNASKLDENLASVERRSKRYCTGGQARIAPMNHEYERRFIGRIFKGRRMKSRKEKEGWQSRAPKDKDAKMVSDHAPGTNAL